jgi:hypothetical protein
VSAEKTIRFLDVAIFCRDGVRHKNAVPRQMRVD